MHRPRQILRAPGGFTLLEIIVATAVAAIVLLVINGTFFSALRLNNTTRDRLDTDLTVQRTLGIVRADLAGLMLPGGVLTGQLQTTLASSLNQGTYGDQVGPDLYTNTGRIDGWGPFSEVQMVDYYLAPANDGSNRKNLIRVVTRNLLPVLNTTPDVQTLLTGVANATVDFYDGTDWTDAWDSSTSLTLPTAIRFQLVLAGDQPGGPARAPIELVVPVVVETATSLAQAGTGGALP
ncbi:MAG: type II secretion system protein GspJ [Opitutales bacterium]